ncbi:NACHT domain-containing protein [Brasilonema sp. UFV-L1]|uniref:NACHT domain-containing protein n=1 Tax=Brasilonema sp. UFV-L1 TaxID=2234130 RepID=UPI00145E2078|nr:NACHT domain-containing protein [Brasilonema sp. UFV-L1]NMG06044.1 hypothetical protein [Brasilonema sp. UFV-L1]
MAAIQVESEIFQLLKQAYSEKFGSSPSSLISRLNDVYKDELEDENENLIADRTIRAFFNSATLPKMQEKNLNYLCGVLLEQKSYQEALRQFIKSEPSLEGDWLDPYWKHLERKCSTMRVLDMTEPILIDNIFANFRVLKDIRGRRQKTIQNLLTNIETDTYQNFQRLLFTFQESQIPAIEAVKSHSKLMVLGKPGAGKTTFLKYLAMHFPTGDSMKTEESLDKIVPIFVQLKELSNHEGNNRLTDVVIHEFSSVPNSKTTVRMLLERGQCLILLDGLDEVKVDKEYIYKEIDALTSFFPENRFVITCRTGACDYVFHDFTEVEVADFNREEIETFVHKWFQAREEEEISHKFLEKLEDNEPVKELATNPLLLTILCLTFQDNYDFSRNRYGLYADAVDSLLRRWDASRRIARQPNFNLSRQRKINMFSDIAYHGLSQKPKKILWYQWELEKEISQFMQNINSEIDSQEILRVIEANNGLLLQQAKGIYSFSHLTFQEYFATEYIVENRKPDFLKTFVEENLIEHQWREVFILTTERLGNADEFLKLMFRCTNDIVKHRQVLQDMLSWLDEITTAANVRSSAWRALYLALDLDVELYISHDTKINRIPFQKLAIKMRQFNIEHHRITPTQPRATLILTLSAIHALAVDHASQHSSTEHINLSHTSEFTRQRLKVDEQSDINDKLNVAINIATEINMTDLANELTSLQNSQPCHDTSGKQCEEWAEELRQVMLKYLQIGDRVKLSNADVNRLENYLYANLLLLACLRGESYASKKLREDILDNSLLPIHKIPTYLLNI